MKTLAAFSAVEYARARSLLAARVSTMLGRKMEEGDWDFVYCNSKHIPVTAWSNLHIDVNYNGVGVEHKMLRIVRSGPILGECGTTKMHPAGTRSIRIPAESDPNLAAQSILEQYGRLIDDRTSAVREAAGGVEPDMRTGWLLWKAALDEFMYFEVPMTKPEHGEFYAEWNVTPARGARKQSRSLWIYERASGRKMFSVTTDAGAKIQPYFDVPPPDDPNLYHFQVRGVVVSGGLVEVWLSKSTARYLELALGSLDEEALSAAILSVDSQDAFESATRFVEAEDISVPVQMSVVAYQRLEQLFGNQVENSLPSDEMLLQNFAMKLHGAPR